MVPARGRAGSPLERRLAEAGFEFEFFQAVRLLLRLRGVRGPAAAVPPAQQVVRFRAHPSMAFPASAIHEIQSDAADRRRAAMTLGFLGLTGPQGVLPTAYTERQIERLAARDRAYTEFLDLFNHRFGTLFYAAWEKHRFFVGYERSGDRPDLFTQALFDLAGMGTGGLRGRMSVPDQAILCYAGLIAQRPRSASALRSMLRHYFRVPVEVEQFHGRWLRLNRESLSYLEGEGPHNQLGWATFAGDEVWERQTCFRIRLGPLDFDSFASFLPNGQAHSELRDLTRFFVGPAFQFVIQLILKRAEVPFCRLHDEGAEAPRLGWLGWLKTEEFRNDAPDAEFLDGE